MSYQLTNIIFNNCIQNFEKKKNINYVLSNKKHIGDGLLYNYRHLLLEKICENKLDIDIYGSCTDCIKEKGDNIKYGFSKDDMLNIYKDYKFSSY